VTDCDLPELRNDWTVEHGVLSRETQMGAIWNGGRLRHRTTCHQQQYGEN
jgi:hypothetical protein